jgi:hypothetical protein
VNLMHILRPPGRKDQLLIVAQFQGELETIKKFQARHSAPVTVEIISVDGWPAFVITPTRP